MSLLLRLLLGLLGLIRLLLKLLSDIVELLL